MLGSRPVSDRGALATGAGHDHRVVVRDRDGHVRITHRQCCEQLGSSGQRLGIGQVSPLVATCTSLPPEITVEDSFPTQAAPLSPSVAIAAFTSSISRPPPSDTAPSRSDPVVAHNVTPQVTSCTARSRPGCRRDVGVQHQIEDARQRRRIVGVELRNAANAGDERVVVLRQLGRRLTGQHLDAREGLRPPVRRSSSPPSPITCSAVSQYATSAAAASDGSSPSPTDTVPSSPEHPTSNAAVHHAATGNSQERPEKRMVTLWPRRWRSTGAEIC